MRADEELRAKDHTPEITKIKLRWKMPLKCHSNCPMEIHLKSGNPLENTTEQNKIMFAFWCAIFCPRLYYNMM